MNKFKPMLAANFEEVRVNKQLPLLVSPKIDGVRATLRAGVFITRSLKEIPNRHVQKYAKLLAQYLPPYLDGELTVGAPNTSETFNRTVSGVMSRGGEPAQITFHVFDYAAYEGPFKSRYEKIQDLIVENEVHLVINPDQFCVAAVPHFIARTMEDIFTYEKEFLRLGYEGIVMRAPNGPYKFGRSTPNEGYLTRLKRLEDGEAEIVGLIELLHNENPQITDALGYAKRSSHKGNKRGGGMLGALQVQDLKTGKPFEIGTGFDESTRIAMWREKETLIGKLVKYKHFGYGALDKPRFPVFLGMRDPLDM